MEVTESCVIQDSPRSQLRHDIRNHHYTGEPPTLYRVYSQAQAFVPSHTISRGMGQPAPMYGGAYGQPLSTSQHGDAYGQTPRQPQQQPGPPQISAHRSVKFSPMSNFSSPASFMSAMSPASFTSGMSPASFITAPSGNNSPAAMPDSRTRIKTIMEDDETDVYPRPQGPFEELRSDYQAELEARELIQPFDKELNWSGKGQHVVFEPKEEVPLEVISHLGMSRTARVEMVRCRRVALARKTMRCKGKWSRNNVLEEVSHLQNLRHFHIVQLVGTYLQGRDFSLLMYPAADCHLGTFLEDTEDIQDDGDRKREYWTRRKFLGAAMHCLASAIHHVHQQHTKHMDLKPQNILVRQCFNNGIPWTIYLADFGLSRSFAEQGHSQTDGPTSITPKYCAPEVYDYSSRGRSSDIFSLGCVYAEILTVIVSNSGRRLNDFTDFRRNDDGDESFHKNLDKVRTWLLENTLHDGYVSNQAYQQVLQMLSEIPDQRPTAGQIVQFFSGFDYFLESWLTPRGCCTQPPEPYVAYTGPPSPLSFPKAVDPSLIESVFHSIMTSSLRKSFRTVSGHDFKT